MASDLTERLAAAITRTGKKITTTEVRNARWIQEVAPFILPLLLSEPELVAGLAPEVRMKLLVQLLELWGHDNASGAVCSDRSCLACRVQDVRNDLARAGGVVE